MPKQWLANVCNSVLKDVFKQWVKNQVDERNQKLAVEKGIMIEVDPEIAEAFRNSTKVSRKYQTQHNKRYIYPYSSTWKWLSYDEDRFEKEKNQS